MKGSSPLDGKHILNKDGEIVAAPRGREDIPFVPIKHGQRSGYIRNCKCDGCVDGNRRYMADYRLRKSNG